ncbi:MAG: helix-turn-helix domain-containing protein [Rikenellaceae bacterium]
MEKSQSYTNVDFTTKDILDALPQISNADLTAVFKLKRETFQSYVRTYRINKACKMIDKNRVDVSLNQIYTSVGFSHYSSFSRSFYAVKNMTPSDYVQTVKGQ